VIVVPLSGRTNGAVRDALLSLGWEGDLASLTGSGLATSAYLVQNLSEEVIEAMVPLAPRLGLELVTGDGWLILAGGRARLGAFARPWVQPAAVQQLAEAIGLAMPAESQPGWRHSRGTIHLDAPAIVGIVNVTPDSFSPPSRAATPEAALRLVERLLEGGATLVDVGGESTRPGATPVSADEELARVVPAVAAIAARHPDLPIAVDTVRASTAIAALDAGACIVNDVTGGRHDPALLSAAARSGAGVVLTHSRGPLGELASYAAAEYAGDVTTAVAAELTAARLAAHAAGIADEAIVLDPGFGFAKRPVHNRRLLQHLDAIALLGRPVLVGVSRKRFLAETVGDQPERLDQATAAACLLAWERGARLFRVHEPSAVRDALAVAAATFAERE
jgi:dihydropteroate synthase